MPEQITIQLEGNKDVITYDEWREFVEKKRGKWRGAASDAGAQALREYVDRHEEDDGEGAATSNDVERLEAEIDRLRAENERLHEENERLHAMLDSGATTRASATDGVVETKNDPASLTKSTSDLDGENEAESAGTEETDETEVWSWEDYDPDADSASIPEDAIKRLPNEFETVDRPEAFHGEQVPAINPDHIKDLPRDANVKAATVAGIVRFKRDVVEIGEIVATAKDVLGIDTTGYVRNAIVFNERDVGPDTAVVEWLAGRHPNDDAQWVTTVDAFEGILDEMETEAESEFERFLEQYVGIAFGAPQYLETFGDTSKPYTGANYVENWETVEDVIVKEMHPLAYRILRDAIDEMAGDGGRYDTPTTSGWSINVWPEWPDTAEEMVRWWDEEKRDSDESFDDVDVERIAESFEEYVPGERREWLDVVDGDDEAAKETDVEGEGKDDGEAVEAEVE